MGGRRAEAAMLPGQRTGQFLTHTNSSSLSSTLFFSQLQEGGLRDGAKRRPHTQWLVSQERSSS